MHRDADGARLVGDRAGDGLPDPPGGVGRELVAAAVLELVDRLHQADVAFLDQVQELQAAVGVFLGDGDHQAQVRLDHLLLGLTSLALALLNGLDDAAVVVDRHAGLGGEGRDLLTDVAHLAGIVLDELGPAHAVRLHRLAPVGIELGAEVGLEELHARDAVAVGQTQQAPFQPHQALVDRIELLDQGLDAVVVQLQRLEVLNDQVRQFVVLLALGLGQVLAGQARLDQALLQLAEGLELGGDRVQRRHDAFAQLGLHGRHRGTGPVVEIVVAVAFALGAFRLLRGGFDFLGFFFLGGDRVAGRTGPGHGAAIGLLEVDHLTQQDAAGAQLLAPHHDGFEGQGALAQAADHGVAAGFDALGDGDLALARQQLHRAHLAQVHAHGIVGAVVGLGLLGHRDGGFLADGHFAALALALALLVLDDVDAHLAQHGEGVFDLLRGDLFGRQNLVQLVHGHVTAGLGLLDEALDASVRQIEQGPVGRSFGFLRLSRRAHPVLRSDRRPPGRSSKNCRSPYIRASRLSPLAHRSSNL